MKKPKFNIGDYVEAPASKIVYELKAKKNIKKDSIYTEKTKKRGVIIGAIYRFKGTLFAPSYYSEDTAYFTASEGVLFWQIREGYINKPFEALEKDIELLISINSQVVDLIENNRKDHACIPWKKTYYTNHHRKQMSREMKQFYKECPECFPRDDKGRFIK